MNIEAIAGAILTFLAAIANILEKRNHHGGNLRDAANVALAQTTQIAMDEISRLNKAVAALQERNALLESQIRSLQTAYAEERLWHAQRIAELENEIEVLRKQLNASLNV